MTVINSRSEELFLMSRLGTDLVPLGYEFNLDFVRVVS